MAGLQPGLSPARRGAVPQVYQLGGICKLVDLLRSPNQNVQQAAAGALRNLVFRSTANKLEARRQNGIREAVSLLRRTGNTEIQKQLTGGGPAAGAAVGGTWGLGRGEGRGGLRRTPLEPHRPVLARLVVPSWCPGYWVPLCAHRRKGSVSRGNLCSERRRPGEDPEGSELWLSHCVPLTRTENPQRSALEILPTGWDGGWGWAGSSGGGVQWGGPGPGPAEPAVPQGCSGTCPPPMS